MADRENVINELNECIEHIRKNEFDKIPFWGNCQSAMMDALELLKEQEKRISRLTLENRLIRQNCQGLEEQREAFAMKLEEMATELKRAKEG